MSIMSIKYLSMKICCKNIHILNSTIEQLEQTWQSNKYIQKLHNFCNKSSLDNGSKIGQKVLGK